MGLPSELAALRAQIETYAVDYGLDFYDVVFETVTFDQMNMIAAYGGFPTRYPHWKFGMEYEQLSKGYEYGLSKIYELVINNDPSYAYLMAANEIVDQKLVMAHVFGHVDFFKNNFSFAHTNRNMMNTMANHGTKVRRYIERYGQETVEAFIDRCLCVENLIDRQAPYIRRRDRHKQQPQERDVAIESIPKLKTNREYMQGYINPKRFVADQKEKLEQEREQERRIPEHPERDIMLFLLEHGPLENWERDILSMLRDEAYYFSPQGQTKIMNEGWASYWHTTIMTQKALDTSEVIDYADRHAGTMGVQPGSINPYKLGLELFRHIERRWDTGRFGQQWSQCDNLFERSKWDTGAGLGREKIFEVRRHYNDVTFIDEFLTVDFAIEQKLFNYAFNQKNGNWEIESRQFAQIKERLLHQLTNFGQPFVMVVDANHDNRGELLLQHDHQGIDLRQDYLRDTLVHIQALWGRPVLLASQKEGQPTMVRFDGDDFNEIQTETGP